MGGQPESVAKSVELFVPSTGHHCVLPNTGDSGPWRYQHSIEKNVICGGQQHLSKSCLTLTNGNWEETTTLLERRLFHSSINTIINGTIFVHNSSNYQVSSLQLGLTIRNISTWGCLQLQHHWEDRGGGELNLRLSIKIWCSVTNYIRSQLYSVLFT